LGIDQKHLKSPYITVSGKIHFKKRDCSKWIHCLEVVYNFYKKV